MLIFIFVCMLYPWVTQTMDYSSPDKLYKKTLSYYIQRFQYNNLKEYLQKEDVRDFLQRKAFLLPWVLNRTTNPLIIKLFIDNGINLDYSNFSGDQTTFHLITENERLFDYDFILALIARHVTKKNNNNELENLYLLLQEIDTEGKTAYKKGYEEEKIYLQSFGRPFLYIDPYVEIILHNQDKNYLKNYIEPIIDLHNTIKSTQKFNVLKNQLPKRNYIHAINDVQTPYILEPTRGIKLLDPTESQKQFIKKMTRSNIFQKIIQYREKYNYDQFPCPDILIVNNSKVIRKGSYYLPYSPTTKEKTDNNPILHMQHLPEIKELHDNDQNCPHYDTPLLNSILTQMAYDPRKEKPKKYVTIWCATKNGPVQTNAYINENPEDK